MIETPRIMTPMKNVYLGHSTAAWYWLHAKGALKVIAQHPRRYVLSDAVSCGEEAHAALDRSLFTRAGAPLSIVTPQGGYRSRGGVCVHRSCAALPAKSFIQLKDNIFIASPELSFVQAATELPFYQLIHYGCALCGGYVLSDESETGILSRDPLSSVKKLQAYLQTCECMNGLKAARKALPYILENSWSPRESTSGLLISLPYKHGGKALSDIRLNQRIDIPAHLRSMTDRNYFVADFFWPGKMVAAEYDSDVAHSGDAPRMTDAIKRNLLPLMGYTPFSFTRLQVNSDREMDKACDNLRALLRVRPRQKIPQDYAQRKAELRRQLLSCSDGYSNGYGATKMNDKLPRGNKSKENGALNDKNER